MSSEAVASAEYVYVVMTTFSGDDWSEEAWNRWYDEVHIRDLLSVPGVNGAIRTKVMHQARTYMTVYHIDTPHVLDSPEYVAVRGWRQWEDLVVNVRRSIYHYHLDRRVD